MCLPVPAGHLRRSGPDRLELVEHVPHGDLDSVRAEPALGRHDAVNERVCRGLGVQEVHRPVNQLGSAVLDDVAHERGHERVVIRLAVLAEQVRQDHVDEVTAGLRRRMSQQFAGALLSPPIGAGGTGVDGVGVDDPLRAPRATHDISDRRSKADIVILDDLRGAAIDAGAVDRASESSQAGPGRPLRATDRHHRMACHGVETTRGATESRRTR